MSKFLVGLVIGIALIVGALRGIRPYFASRMTKCEVAFGKSRDVGAAIDCVKHIQTDMQKLNSLMLGK